MSKPIFKNPLPSIKSFFKNEPQIWISFLIPFAVMLIVYLLFGVYPIKFKRGDNMISNSVLSLDLNAQYAYYFAYMKDVFAGKASLFYSWSRNLSGEFVGIIGYYLFSPFNILVWIFPLSHLTEGLLLMIITKMGFIGATMAIYLSKSRKFPPVNTIVFSVMYAFMSYNIEQTMNPMWLDGVMILPIVIMGIEALMREGRYKLLIFSLFYAFVTCFYIGYMIGIFSALYFIYYVFASRKANGKDMKIILKRGALFAAVAVIAVFCACFMLMPVYSSLSMGKFSFSKPDWSMRSNFAFLDIIRKLYPNSYDTVRMDGLPFLFCGTLTLLLLPAYFFCSRVRRAKRVSGAVLITVLTVSMYIAPVDMFWHGRQVPNWLPYRYSFMLCFLFLAFAAEAFRHIKTITGKTLGITALIFSLLLLYLEKSDTFIEDLGAKGREVFDKFTVILPALGLLILFAAFIVLARNKLANKSFAAGVALISLVSLEMYYNTQWSVYKQHKDITYSTRDSFNDVILPTREVADKIQKDDPGFYRVEKLYFRSANDPMALGIKGVTHSSSLLNSNAIDILKRLGYASRSHASRYSGATPITDVLFGFKYTLSCKDNNTVNIKSAADITVTEHPDAMPIAYITDPEIMNVEFDRYDVFKNQSRLLGAMLGLPENLTPDYYKRMVLDGVDTENLKEDKYGDAVRYTKIADNAEANAYFYFTADEEGDYYMYLPTSAEYKCDLYVNDYPMGAYFETDNHYIKKLGRFEAGESVTVRLKLQKDRVVFNESMFMRLDENLLNAHIAELHGMNMNTVFEAKSDTSLKITTNYLKNGVLFASIPNEPGWTVKIDGKEVDFIRIEDDEGNLISGMPVNTLACIEVPAGQHTVTMTFFPNLLPFGISMTFLGISLIMLLNSILYKASVKHPKKESDIGDEYDGYDADYVPVYEDDEEEQQLNFDDFGYDISDKEEDGGDDSDD